MTRDKFAQIGIDRLVRLEWLEKVAFLTLAGNFGATLKSILQTDLQHWFRSNNTSVRGSIDKTITILLKVWVRVPVQVQALRDDGLDLLKRFPRPDHLAIHWGMVTAVYPFWSNVAIQVGRLLKLQGTATAIHVQRRMREQYGERETVSRRTRYILRSFLDWGVLQETGSKGIYTSGTTLSVEDPRLIAWLVEASLHARANGSASLRNLLDSPSFFPFRFKPIQAESIKTTSTRIEILRHGLDDDLIMLRKPTTKGGAP